MDKHKSYKINDVINNSEDLNLHQIKAKTGAGIGYSNTAKSKIATEPTPNDKSYNSKIEKIHKVVNESDRKLNLHEIKAKTGAGSGHKHSNFDDKISDIFVNRYKSHTIYDVVTSIEGKANLHKIKAATGAGNGYIDNSKQTNLSSSDDDLLHKSHKIHAIFHKNDRKLNLHEIKARTGAGSGYKH